jgi:ATP phosphoribosyltransferase regulatory subunit
MQVGLECLGDVDDYSVIEVLYLAAKSLDCFSENNVLDLSHLGLVKAVIEYCGVSEDGEEQIIGCLSEKNAEGVRIVCENENLDQEKIRILTSLVSIYGPCSEVLDKLCVFAVNEKAKKAIDSLRQTVEGLNVLGVNQKIRIDFSVINDVKYYNGVVFKGFVSGIPSGILSGGQYDNLMAKMGKKSRAVGFAVYLDDIERLADLSSDFDVDVAIESGSACSSEILKTVKSIVDGGESVLVERKIPQSIKYKRIIKL